MDDLAADADRMLVDALRAGDEAVFATLVDRYTPSMVRVASRYVPSRAVAEEVVQETWLAVLAGIGRFEGRSSLKTWLFGIVVNIARSRGRRERRSVPFSSAFPDDGSGPTVDPDRFVPPGGAYPGHWASPPSPWDVPEAALASSETRRELRAALDELPPRQRAVVELRDVQGLEADAVSTLLGISPGNERVLLHRGRAKLRAVLAGYLVGEAS